MPDKDKIRADVSDLFFRSAKKKDGERSPSVHITIGNVGNDSVLVVGDSHFLGYRRQEDAIEDDNPACHGRRDSDQAIREEIAALHYRVRALSRLIAHLMSGR